MVIYYTLVAFIFGAVLGSFYNVVGYRLPRNQSLIKPSSHCTTCNHELGASELVPIFSWLFRGGRCKVCKSKVSAFYTVFELITGILFSISYLIFKNNIIDFFISITFISVLLIVIISDYQTFIIPDEVLIFGFVAILIELFIKGGFSLVLESLFNVLISFLIMFLIKKLGDFIFKKESMGFGDIKLLGFFGLLLGWKMSLISIFLASFIGLPYAIFKMSISKNNVIENDDDEIPENSIPFGPFLSIAAIIIWISRIDWNTIINFIIK